VHLELKPADYIDYIKRYKQPSPRTLIDYADCLKNVGIDNFNSDNVEVEVYKPLLERLEARSIGYVDVARFLTIISSWYRKNTGKSFEKALYYSKLHDLIESRKGIRVPYSDPEIIKVMDAAGAVGDDYNTLRLVYMIFYSGLRISSAQGVTWRSVTVVPSNPDIVTYRVRSKGVEYNAFMPTKLFSHLRNTVFGTLDEDSPIVAYDTTIKTPFMIGYAAKLKEALQRKNPNDDYINLRKGKSLFHSLRKAFAQKLANAGLTKDSLQLLMSHNPPDIAYTKYIMPDRHNQPTSLVEKMAADYARVRPLMNLDLMYQKEAA
jgi:integrase